MSPPRQALLFQTHNDLSREAAQAGLWMRLSSMAPARFTGAAEGWIEAGMEATPGLLRFDVASDLGAGHLDLSLAAGGWVKAELFVDGQLAFRAWIEDPYEEKEGWPDGADGVGEGPLRISKHGTWLQIEAARFPGVPGDADGWFTLKDAAA